MKWMILCALLSVAACGETVDTTGLPSIEGYQDWTEYDFTTPVPGHNDSYRRIFINPVARTYPHGGRYPIGSVLVKEVHEKTDDGLPGDLRYIAVMRKVEDDQAYVEEVEVDAPTDGGWVFTQIKGGGDETHLDLCWSQCHKQAPYDGAWIDYGN
jgi:hypothetical protein